MNDIITKHKLETTYDKNGNKVLSDEWESKKRGVNVKNGWFRMYDEMITTYNLCKSQKENQMLGYIILNTKKNLTIFIPTIELAKKFEVSKVTATKFINKLKDADFVRGSRGHLFVNPNHYIPKNVSNELVKNIQDTWDELKDER